MPRRHTAIFGNEHDLVHATTECRQKGFEIEDVYTPYAVHGLDEAMGLRRSRLTWVAFFAGGVGFSAMLGFQIWTSAVDWPLVIGGKAPLALPAFIPVAFEAMVLVAALTTMVALFMRSKLWPGKEARLADPRATDDRFVLVLLERNAVFDQGKAEVIFRRHHAFDIRQEHLPQTEATR